MSVSEFDVFQDQQRSNWVRMRTLVILRWFAAAGQTLAIVVAIRFYDFHIETGLAAVTIGVSVVANLISSFVYLENKRLSEREASLWLVFDLLQLGVLLFLTGGINNPFALLILAPVTIAATVLHLRSTVFLGVIAICVITAVSVFNYPITTASGVVLDLPFVFQFGFWSAIVVGIIFLAVYTRQVTTEMHAMAEALVATQLALAREQKLTDLGGVVAAAAHELGTPLATIKLVGSELMEELHAHPELREDAALIRDQADRCRDILQSMGRVGKDDLHLRRAPVETIIREAAEPHVSRGKSVHFDIAPMAGTGMPQPIITRRPDIIHGLRNLIQNAVDFSTSQVTVALRWSKSEISITISDDGPGFPPSVIGRIGDPYVRRRRAAEDGVRRPGYQGMGLGLFIAKTLLERSGGKLTFANSRRHGHANWKGQATGGAVINLRWTQSAFAKLVAENKKPLGKNIPNKPWVEDAF